jgi:hypothetical protein
LAAGVTATADELGQIEQTMREHGFPGHGG